MTACRRQADESKGLCLSHLLTTAKVTVLTPLTCKEAEEKKESQSVFRFVYLISQLIAMQSMLSELTSFPSGFFSFKQLSVTNNFYLAAFPYYIQLEAIFNSSSNPSRKCTFMEKASLTSELYPS